MPGATAGTRYASYAQFLLFGLPQSVIAGTGLLQEDVEAHLDVASGDIDRDLVRSHGLPLTAWGMDIVLDTCSIAAYNITSLIGYISDGKEDNYRKRYDDVVKRRPGILSPNDEIDVDATPSVVENAPDALSRPLRGW